MKKMIMLILMVFIISILNGQKATITISHTVYYDSLSIFPDSIMVTNMTQGYDTILYIPDTTLVLDYTVGINESQNDNNAFIVMPNYPNPFKSLTHFNVVIPEPGDVSLKVFDIAGKEISALSGNYLFGKHKFSFETSKTGSFVLQVKFKNKISSIKVQSMGGNSYSENEISYRGYESTEYNNKSFTAKNGFDYTFGDKLRSVVYYQSLSDTTEFIPTQDTLITIQFQSTNICPATFTDARDNKVYSTLHIGAQCWMAENLNYSTPNSWCYDDTSANCDIYGRLYTWNAVMAGAASSDSVPSGVQGVCPVGWHLPSDEEWKILEGAVDSQFGYPSVMWDGAGWRGTDAGGNLKEADTIHWDSPNTGGTNSSGFTVLPAGQHIYDGSCYGLGRQAKFWTSTETSNYLAYYRYLFYSEATICRGYSDKGNGWSCRCLKD